MSGADDWPQDGRPPEDRVDQETSDVDEVQDRPEDSPVDARDPAFSPDASPFDKSTPFGTLLLELVIFFVFGIIVSCVLTVAIWPGELKLTAPVFCPDGQSETMVVADVTVSDGETNTNYTLYCIGERGEITDVGFAKPFFLVSAAHAALLWFFVLVTEGLGGRGHMPRRRGGPAEVAQVQGGFAPPIIADQ